MNSLLCLTWKRMLRIYWEFFWRSILLMTIAAFVLGFISPFTHFVFRGSGISDDLFKKMIGYIKYFGIIVISIVAPFFALRMVLTKRFRDFSIALLSNK